MTSDQRAITRAEDIVVVGEGRRGLEANGPEAFLGRRLGHCRLRDHLSRGGMGDVYAADHLHLGRQVAIKVPRLDTSEVFFNQQRLLAEARHLARVAHVNVVAVHDLGYTRDGLAFLVMEYLEGSSLDRILERTPFLGLPEVIHLVRELARGLGACHRSGILVCDVKPENVMVVGGPLIGLPPQGTVWTKIIDLGAALHLPTEAGKPLDAPKTPRVGTPAYASPELIRGHALDTASDVYSLGVLLYELLAGCFPFHGETDEDMLRMHVDDVPTPLSEHRADIAPSSPLELFVDDCLAKDPHNRPRDMVTFLNRLDRAARQSLIQRSGDESLCGDLQPRKKDPRNRVATIPVSAG